MAWRVTRSPEAPPEMDTDRYDIEAKAEGNPTREQMMRMLQTLLEDRFQLRIRREQREGAIYALTVARGGPKLTASVALKDGERAGVFNGRTGSPTAAALSYWKQGRHASMAMLSNSLEGTLLLVPCWTERESRAISISDSSTQPTNCPPAISPPCSPPCRISSA